MLEGLQLAAFRGQLCLPAFSATIEETTVFADPSVVVGMQF
jgi:hypothetical protein